MGGRYMLCEQLAGEERTGTYEPSTTDGPAGGAASADDLTHSSVLVMAAWADMGILEVSC